jgi:hypothetical protein
MSLSSREPEYLEAVKIQFSKSRKQRNSLINLFKLMIISAHLNNFNVIFEPIPPL